MKQSFIRRLAFATIASLAASALAAPVVSAQLKPAPSAAGNWSFKTGQLRGDCDISGDMVIRETGGGWTGVRWAAFQFAYMLALAYGSALLVYQGGRMLGLG